MTLREQYDAQLYQIQADMVRMGSLVNDMVRCAVDATVHGDSDLAAKVLKSDDDVDRLEQELIQSAVHAMLRESPVAQDLRLLVSALGVVGEIEKAGDDAVKLARRATKLTGHFPAEMKLALNELGEEARRVFSSAIKLCSEYDSELANQVIRADKDIDSHYVQARDRIIEILRKDPTEAEHLVRSIEAFHALEHLADHAVEIARRLKVHHES